MPTAPTAASRRWPYAEALRRLGVIWFEEPVSSPTIWTGLHLLRDRGPGGMDIAAGEYGYDLHYFRRMLEAGAVDVLQADATRCGGVTGFLQVGRAVRRPLPGTVGPLRPVGVVHPCLATMALRPLEYFHDHQRIETMLLTVRRHPGRCLVARSDTARHGRWNSSTPTPSVIWCGKFGFLPFPTLSAPNLPCKALESVSEPREPNEGTQETGFGCLSVGGEQGE